MTDNKCSFCQRLKTYETCTYCICNDEYKEIPLSPPQDRSCPRSLLESEYIKVENAFNTSINQSSGIRFRSATLIVNKKLEKNYYDKKQQLNTALGSVNTGEIICWHGSNPDNYASIMRDGFKIGGVDVPVKNGTSYGYGIYSARSPNDPISYSHGSKKIILFLGLQGRVTTQRVNEPSSLNTCGSNSYSPVNDWWIFFSKEKSLPRFLVEFA